MATRDKIKEVQDLGKEVIHIPEWDVDIEVRGITARQRSKMMESCIDEKGKVIQTAFQKFLIINSCYDVETGNQLFGNDDDWIMEKASAPVDRISGIAMKLSGIGKVAEVQAEKN